jgi:parvulin-like peptidyl-prolyl isomerase
LSVQPEKAARRRRKTPPRRLASVVEERERKPMFFGWGAELTHREKEALKERIALFAGIGLALMLVVILGVGWYQDNVAGPAAIAAENNKEIAQVGSDTIHMGYFKTYQAFRQNELNSQLTNIQTQIQSIQSDPKLAKQDAAQVAQYQSESSQLQQRLAALATNSINDLIENEVLYQRAPTLGVSVSPKEVNNALITFERTQVGGRQHFVAFLAQSGLTVDEFSSILKADLLRNKVVKVLSAHVAHVQTKVRASHILILTKKKALAERLYHQVLNGANFAALAKKYSTDPGSATKGGDLGYFTQGIMVPQFDKAAFAMKVGEIRLVQSSYGWHIIKKTGTERVRLTASEYSQAQQQAYSTWVSHQQALLHVQRFVAASALPTPVATSAIGSLPASNTNPIVPASVPTAAPAPAPQPAPKKATSKKP